MRQRDLFFGTIAFAAASVFWFLEKGNNAQAKPLAVDTLGAATLCGQDVVGLPSDFSAWVRGPVSLQSTDFSGRVAVGGDLALRDSSVGTQLPEDSRRVDLSVHGRASFLGGAVPNGALVSGGERTLRDVVLAFSPRTESLLAADTFEQGWNLTSRRLAKLNRGGILNVHNPLGERYEVYMQASDPGLNVFVLQSNDLANAHTLRVEGAETSTVVIVVKGENVAMNAVASDYIGVRRANVLFYFPEANTLLVRSTRIQGAVFAADANVELVNAVVDGQFVSKSLVGKGEFRRNAFLGCIPE
jgi:choice-of-anchor A domain-containing protein